MTHLPEEATGHEPGDDAEPEPAHHTSQERGDPVPGPRLSEEERRRYEAFKAEVFGSRCGSQGC